VIDERNFGSDGIYHLKGDAISRPPFMTPGGERGVRVDWGKLSEVTRQNKMRTAKIAAPMKKEKSIGHSSGGRAGQSRPQANSVKTLHGGPKDSWDMRKEQAGELGFPRRGRILRA